MPHKQELYANSILETGNKLREKQIEIYELIFTIYSSIRNYEQQANYNRQSYCYWKNETMNEQMMNELRNKWNFKFLFLFLWSKTLLNDKNAAKYHVKAKKFCCDFGSEQFVSDLR